jgi:hypothetical protein
VAYVARSTDVVRGDHRARCRAPDRGDAITGDRPGALDPREADRPDRGALAEAVGRRRSRQAVDGRDDEDREALLGVAVVDHRHGVVGLLRRAHDLRRDGRAERCRAAGSGRAGAGSAGTIAAVRTHPRRGRIRSSCTNTPSQALARAGRRGIAVNGRRSTTSTLRRRRVVAVCVLLVLGLAAVAVGVRATHAGQILPGVEVEGVALGGASRDEARALLAPLAAEAADVPVVLVAEDRRVTIAPRDAGYAVDVEATISRALAAGRGGPLGGLWATVAGVFGARRAVALAETVDARRLEQAVA